MLTEIAIRNLAVVESVQLHFGQGFLVLTGETGAGKSIVIDALSLIAGGRGSSELVRYGCDKAEIEALFEIPPGHAVWDALDRLGIRYRQDEPVLIRREVTIQGKSTGRINGQIVNLSMLREIGDWLVNIHGQHEHQSLLHVDQHGGLLDMYGGEQLLRIKSQYEASYRKYAGFQRELAQLRETSQQALQMADLYRFQVEEIAAAELSSGEDELLQDEKRKLANAEKRFAAANDSYEALHESNRGLDCVGIAMRRLEEAAQYDRERLAPLLEQVQTAYYQLEDAAFQLRDYMEGIEFNPSRLEQIEDRLNHIASLKRKYGNSTEAVLQHLHTIENELDRIVHKDDRIKEIEAQAAAEFKQTIRLAGELSALRRSAAAALADDMVRELSELQMEKVRFEADIRREEAASGWDVNGVCVKFTADGWDRVEFMISPNPGEPLKPLGKIASGGELSRIMLAMKSIFAGMESIPVLVFDEVDTGVSGRAAQAIAEKLSRLGEGIQVFSITHLPQVACMADAHYLIRKEIEGERTYTHVEELDEAGRVNELARMLGGVEVTATTQRHAREMLKMARVKVIRSK